MVAHFLWDKMSVKKKLISAQGSTNLHGNVLHVVADEVAQLFVAAIAAILLAVAHLRVVDACRVAAPPVQLRVAVGTGSLGFREK